MSARLTQNRYGKHSVRVSKIRRPREADPKFERHEFVEVAVDIELEGDFETAYTAADNKQVIATDTCKNTVYAVAKTDDLATIESFGLALAHHFNDRYAHVSCCKVSLTETVWERIGNSLHGFTARDRSLPTAVVTLQRDQAPVVLSGVKGLLIAKTTESGFEEFHQDEYRTLPDVSDRILATEVSAEWTNSVSDDYPVSLFTSNRTLVMDALFVAFLDHYSRSVQDTLYRMGDAALEACDNITEIALTMPNKHHILASLVPEGTSNDNEVFVVTDEPFGFIQGTVTRG